MLFRKSKVYCADVYKAENYEEKGVVFGDCVIKSISYDKEIMWKNAMLIKVNDLFIPLNLIRTPLEFVTLKICASLGKEPKGLQKFLFSYPSDGKDLFVEEPKKVFNDKGFITDKKLSAYYIDDEEDCCSKENYLDVVNYADKTDDLDEKTK